MPHLRWITSRKHPGAVFLKAKGRDNFVCKFYEGKEKEARMMFRAPDAYQVLRTIRNRLKAGQAPTNENTLAYLEKLLESVDLSPAEREVERQRREDLRNNFCDDVLPLQE